MKAPVILSRHPVHRRMRQSTPPLNPKYKKSREMRRRKATSKNPMFSRRREELRSMRRILRRGKAKRDLTRCPLPAMAVEA